MKETSSKLIQAIASYCEKYSDDPNLFPLKTDTVLELDKGGVLISEHPECSSDELKAMAITKFTQGNTINA